MGLSFGEVFVIALLALVVIGPKDLPKILRSAGRFLGQARRAIDDVRRDTGLHEVLRGDFEDLERLADHIENIAPYRGDAKQATLPFVDVAQVVSEREYPVCGADSAALLPDDAPVYVEAGGR